MQKKHQDAQPNFDKNPCVETRKVLEKCKMNLERFMVRKLKVSLCARGQGGLSMGKKY